MHILLWVIAVVGELIFSFMLFYGVFYGAPMTQPKLAGVLLGVVLWAFILGGLAAPSGMLRI